MIELWLIKNKGAILEGIAALLIMAALAYGYHLWADHYIKIGEKNIQSQWDAQKLVDEKAKLNGVAKAREVERLNAIAQAKIDEQNLKDHENEKSALIATINDIAAHPRQLRAITGKAIGFIAPGVSIPSTSTGISDENCTVQLPPEIGRSFQELRELVIRTGSEANDTADQLRACQAIIEQDRLTCNGHR